MTERIRKHRNQGNKIMKVRFSFRIFLLFTCLLTFASAVAAQEKTQALKFDEFDDSTTNRFYSYYNNDELSFAQRIERFTKQLAKERGVVAYVIYYKARINNSDVERSFINAANGIKNQIQFNDRIKIEGVIIINAGYRERNTVEFWIVPKNAELPAPTPTFDKSETFVCPYINIYGNVPYNEAKMLTFSIPSYYLRGVDNYSLTWKVSAGEIVEGQGLDFIKVKLNDSSLKRVTAFVEIGGLPYPCQKVFSAAAEIKGKLHLIDSFGQVSNGDIKARLDSFLVDLQNNPITKGYIIVYGDRTDKLNRDVERRITLINNHFRFRNFDVSRITIVRGGFREELSSELWLSFGDGEKPIPTPTVDEKFIIVPKLPKKLNRRKK